MRERLRPHETLVMVTGLLAIMAFLLVTPRLHAAGPAGTGTNTGAARPRHPQHGYPEVSGTLCTGDYGPADDNTYPEGKQMVTFTESDNGATKEIAPGSPFAVRLQENPTTGIPGMPPQARALRSSLPIYRQNSHRRAWRAWAGSAPGYRAG